MDMREKLLNSEIQHLGQMIQILSYELTILNDFVREKFGSSYESFRSKHSRKNETVINPSAAASKSKESLRVSGPSSSLHKRQRDNEREESDNLQEKIEVTPPPVKMVKLESSGAVALTTDESEDEDHDSQEFSGNEDIEDEDHQDEVEVKFPEGSVIIDPMVESKSKKRKAIWAKFIVARLPNQKILAKCRICFSKVSTKVERLTNHYEKCSRGEYAAKKKFEQLRRERLSLLADKRHEGDMNDDLYSQTKRSGNRGKSLDQVWGYFDVTETDEPGKYQWKKKTVKCKKCRKEVSPKVERVRKHFMICFGIMDSDSKELEGSAGMDGQCDVDPLSETYDS